jgi:uncharacterized protein (DUF2235 family)
MAESRNIILCFDGTTQEFSINNSNIVKLNSLFSKDDPSKQACYYQPGLGQYFNPGTVPAPLQGLAQGMDWAFAWSLDQHIIDGYRFIMQEWKEGDRIYIFGFSRGSYQARCVAGMLQKIGLLPKENEQSLPFAYQLYARTDTEGNALASSYKRSFSRDVKTDFLGVFDTVSSVGLVVKRELPYTSSNPGVKVFRHVLALDERRFRFLCSPWTGPIPFPWTDFLTTPRILIPQWATNAISRMSWGIKHPASTMFLVQEAFGSGRLDEILSAGLGGIGRAPDSSRHSSDETDVKEVWFTGGHEDTGGGAVNDAEKFALCNITLRWMVLELFACDAPIEWNRDALCSLFDAKRGRLEEDLEALDDKDASTDLHDFLGFNMQAPIWWFFELQPLSWTWEEADRRWFRQFRVGLARGRVIDLKHGRPKVYYTVKKRMNNPKLHYKPRADFGDNPEWIYPNTEGLRNLDRWMSSASK